MGGVAGYRTAANKGRKKNKASASGARSGSWLSGVLGSKSRSHRSNSHASKASKLNAAASKEGLSIDARMHVTTRSAAESVVP